MVKCFNSCRNSEILIADSAGINIVQVEKMLALCLANIRGLFQLIWVNVVMIHKKIFGGRTLDKKARGEMNAHYI